MNSSNHKFSPLPLFFCALTALASATFAQSEDGEPRREPSHRLGADAALGDTVKPDGERRPIELTVEFAGTVATVAVEGGRPNAVALVVLGSSMRPVSLAPIGIDGALVVSDVFAVVPVTLDGQGRASWKVDLIGTDFAKYHMSVYMQILQIEVAEDGSLSGEASKHVEFRFRGAEEGRRRGRPFVGSASDPTPGRQPASVSRGSLGSLQTPAR